MQGAHRVRAAGRGLSRDEAGAFTLLELMITAAILALLTAVAFPRYQQARNAALISALVGELNGLPGPVPWSRSLA